MCCRSTCDVFWLSTHPLFLFFQPMSLNLHVVGLHFVENITWIRFRTSVRGWTNDDHRFHTQTLHNLYSRSFTGSLTVNEPVKFREYRLCLKRRGDDLDEEMRTIHSKECKGCVEILQTGITSIPVMISTKCNPTACRLSDIGCAMIFLFPFVHPGGGFRSTLTGIVW